MKPHRRVDATGARLSVGDAVRIIGVPDLSGMSQSGRRESLPIFRYLVGKYKQVLAFDQFGCVELSFVIRSKAHRPVNHTVWLEPFLVRRRQSRSNPSLQPTRYGGLCPPPRAAELKR